MHSRLQRKLVDFTHALRRAGLRLSTAEVIDAMRAVEIVGIDRQPLRDGLASVLIKDEADRPTYDATFDAFFAIPRSSRQQRRVTPSGGERGARPQTDFSNGESGRIDSREPRPSSTHRLRREAESADTSTTSRRNLGVRDNDLSAASRLARLAHIARQPFSRPPGDREECRLLADALSRRFRAHFRRRQRRVERGRIDLRRTVRRAAARGGVPLPPEFRAPRPGKSDLVVLCDVSHSMAPASEFLLALLAPVERYFREVVRLAYVDHPVEVEYENGHLLTATDLDLYARSDFGKVLTTVRDRHAHRFGRNTLVLILGDARNNRRPPRGDVLAWLRPRVKALVWLNPEDRARWNSGDSVIGSYAKYVDLLLAARSPIELEAALLRALR